MRESQGQSRGGTPEGERTLQGARRNASCGGYGLRLTAFRILLFRSFVRMAVQSAIETGSRSHRRFDFAETGSAPWPKRQKTTLGRQGAPRERISMFTYPRRRDTMAGLIWFQVL